MKNKRWNKNLSILLSTSLVASVVVPQAAVQVNAEDNKEEVFTADLLISEYIEGTGTNKAIELFNGTGKTINLSEYTLELHTNGLATAGNKLNLTGELEHGKTYVIYNSTDPTVVAVGNLKNASVINFNGNDQIVLRKNGVIVDSIGQVNNNKDIMKDMTLVRKATVLNGDTIIDDEFDPTVEWESIGLNNYTNLGKHTITGIGAPPEGGTPDPEEPTPPTIISIADARAANINDEVTIKGVVAANLKNTISIQDETAGIALRSTTLNAAVGDEVTVKGIIGTYNGLLQLNVTSIIEHVAGKGEPAPLLVDGNGIKEENESKLVEVKNVTLTSKTSGSGWANYTATDGVSTFIVRDERGVLTLEEGMTYEKIVGIIQEFTSSGQTPTYQLIPRSQLDIIVDSTAKHPVEATPGTGTFVGGTNVTLSTKTAGAEIYYTVDKSDPKVNGTLYTGPIAITETTTINAITKYSDGTYSDVYTFEYTIADALRIHDIQGASHVSPYLGKTVENIQGIVTYSFKLNNNNYYHIQTPDDQIDNDPNTSEGIVLFSGNQALNVKVGDLVSVNGKVDEYAIDGYSDRQTTDLKITQINVRADQGGKVTVVQSDVALPEPILIDDNNLPTGAIDSDQLKVFNPETDAIDFWESLEGMRVQFNGVKAVSPQEHGDLITVLESRKVDTIHGGLIFTSGQVNPDRIQFKLYDNTLARGFTVATGDRFEGPIIGVVNYGYQNYKVLVDYEEMKAKHVKGNATPEKTTIKFDEKKLTIASYNLENFSNNTKETSADKAAKLARAFANDMNNPDIIGVTEVQDNNGESAGDSKANESYERLINEIVKAGGVKYEYVNIDPVNNEDGGAPNANIRVGFLYNPERVQLTDGIPTGDATKAVGYEDGKLTLNPGRIDPNNEAFKSSRKPLAAQFDFNGESVIVLVNHWNSKSGDTPLFGAIQPPQLNSEIQRKKIAQIVNNFVTDILTKNPEANIVSVGDFNDYEFSDALKIHEGTVMTNMINKVPDSDRYTYLYQGNSQVLDHILVSNKLVDTTAIDILHINADFTDMAGRASDHDPVMVQIDLSNSNVEEPVAPIVAEKTTTLDKINVKSLKVSSPSILVDYVSGTIEDGIFVTSAKYAEFKGAALKAIPVTIKPSEAGAIINFNGLEIDQVTIDGPNVKEIRGAENIKEIIYINGADKNSIILRDKQGAVITAPSSSIGLMEYYQSAYNKTGKELKQALHEIIDDHIQLSYSQVWEALKITDEDPNNPNNVILLYTGLSRSKSLNGGNVGQWNREHVWAQSHGNFGTTNGPGTDIHHLRPTDVQTNSARGNKDFDYGGTAVKTCELCKSDADSWEPPDAVKGDVARMLLYMAVRYESGDKVDLELNDNVNNGSKPFHGKISVLLEWHKNDPVSEWEKARNEKIYKIQGNRNPFIDYPEFAELIMN